MQIIETRTPPPQPPEKTYVVELTFDEMVRLYMLSHQGEGGDKYPWGHGATEPHKRLHESCPEDVALEAEARIYSNTYRHPGNPGV